MMIVVFLFGVIGIMVGMVIIIIYIFFMEFFGVFYGSFFFLLFVLDLKDIFVCFLWKIMKKWLLFL